MKSKFREYLKRYLFAEILGTVLAVIAATVVLGFSENKIAAAVGGAWGETIGFYIAVISQEIIFSKKHHRLNNKRYNLVAFGKNIRNIFLEFGPSEVFDSFLIRPAAMYFFTTLFSNLQLGIFIGKIVADITFYIPAIISYELKKKYLKD